MKSVNCKMQQKRTQAFLVIWTGSLLQWFLDDLSFTFNAEDDRRPQLFIRGVVIPFDIQCYYHDWPRRATWFDGAQGLGAVSA
jgi:hypothetical protein